MERRIVLAKTTKGMMEIVGRTHVLPREIRAVLHRIDDSSTADELVSRVDPALRREMGVHLAHLKQEGFIVDRDVAVPLPQDGREVVQHSELDFTGANEFASVESVVDGVARVAAVSDRATALRAAVNAQDRTDAAPSTRFAPEVVALDDANMAYRAPQSTDETTVSLDDATILRRTPLGLKATLGQSGGLSADALTLLGLMNNPVTLGEACARFGLGAKYLTDCVVDLLVDGYLAIDDQSGVIGPAAELDLRPRLEDPAWTVQSLRDQAEADEVGRIVRARHARDEAVDAGTPSPRDLKAPPVAALGAPIPSPTMNRPRTPPPAAVACGPIAVAPADGASISPMYVDQSSSPGRSDQETLAAIRREDDKRRARDRAEAAARDRRSARAAEKLTTEVPDHVLADGESPAPNTPAGRAVTTRLHAELARRFRRMRSMAIATVIALAVVSGFMVWLMHGLEVARVEAAASAELGAPVRIRDVALSVWPRPAVVLRDVAVGADGHFKAATVRAILNPSALIGGDRPYSRIEVQDAVIASEFLWTLGSESRTHALPHSFDLVQFADATIVDTHWSFTGLSAAATMARSGQMQSLKVQNADRSVSVTLSPEGSRKAAVAITAKFFQPGPASIAMSGVVAEGTMTPDALLIRAFEGQASGGSVRGAAQLRSGPRWSLDGRIEARSLYLAGVAPALFRGGKANGQARFAMSGPSLGELFLAPTMSGLATIHDGAIAGFDLSRGIQGSNGAGGATAFSQGSANFQLSNNRLAVTGIRFGNATLSVDGNADIDAQGNFTGRLLATLSTPGAPLTGDFALGGTFARPVIKPLP
ncbi:MAG: hypothetical protein ACKVQU_21440 [Burkholderiales bacterium]